MISQKKEFPALIQDILRARPPRTIADKDHQFHQAAVLIPLFFNRNAYHVLFTKRTNRVETHKGQISFPGGHVDEGDSSFQETALREAFEEVGLQKKDVHVLGRTDDAGTVSSNFIIHPFVGLIPYPYPFRINEKEVRNLIEVPLEKFMVEDTEDRTGDVEYGGKTYHGVVYPCGGEVIWGATARIMENFIEIVRDKLNLLVKDE